MSSSPSLPPTAPIPRTFGPIPPISRTSPSSSPPPTLSPTPLSAALRSRSGSGAAATASTWLNALSDGLNWIEVQGGSVVAQAAEKGLGETLRGGLARRPLSFSSFGNGPAAMSSAASSDGGGGGGSAVDLAASPPSSASAVDNPRSNLVPNVESGLRFPRIRPSSLLAVPRAHLPSSPSAGEEQPPPPRGNMGPPAPSNLARLNSAAIPSRTTSLGAPSGPEPAKRTHRPSLSQPQHAAPINNAITRSSSSSATLGGLHHQASASSMREPTGTMHATRSSSYAGGNLVVRSISRSPSNASMPASATSASPERPRQMPYKPGYQPPGVRRSRMEEYERARGEVEEMRGREEGRLGRRWGKLLDLHFNPSGTTSTTTPNLPRSTSFNDRRRSLLSMPADGMKAKDVWRGLRSVSGVGVDQVAEEKKREAEMGIVKWEDDAEVKRCRICQSVFSLTNRKHHCRLCGRIVCSLPPTSPSILTLATTSSPDTPISNNHNQRTGLPMGIRREKCSLLLVADWKTGRGEVVEEGFIGWMKMEPGGQTSIPKKKRLSEGGSIRSAASDAGGGEEVQVKGVRCCRECWAVVSRKQKMADRRRVSGFTRLYDALKEVETEILDLLPELQEMLLSVSSTPPTLVLPPPIPSDLVALHKHILILFTQYDALAKKIRSYPLARVGGGGGGGDLDVEISSQKRVQEAIARSAASFVSKEAGILQALPKLQKQWHRHAASSINSGDTTPFSEASNELLGVRVTSKLASEVDDELALKIQPLLEQEAMLEEYIKEANAQRKFDDAQTLKSSLDDIKEEIGRIAAGAA